MTTKSNNQSSSEVKQWLLGAAFGVSQLGSTAVVFSVGAEMVLNQRYQDLTLVFACSALAAPIAHLWGGVVVDSLKGAKRVFLVGAALASISQVVLAILVFNYGAALAVLIPFLMLTKFSSSVSASSSQRMIRGMFTEEDIGKAIATVSLTKTVGMVAAPAVGTFLVMTGGLSWALLFDAGTFLVAMALVVFLSEKNLAAVPKMSMFSRMAEGLAFCRSVKGMMLVILVDCVACGLWSVSFNVGVQAIILSDPDGGQALWGTVVGASVVGILIGGLIARKFSPARTMTWAMLSSAGTALPILSVMLPCGMVTVISLVFVGYCGIGMASAWSSYGLQKLVPTGLLGRVFSFSIATQLAAPPLVGFLSRGLNVDFRDVHVQLIFGIALVMLHLVGLPASKMLDNAKKEQQAVSA